MYCMSTILHISYKCWFQMLAQARGLDFSKLLKLAQVQSELKASLDEMLALVEEVLHPEPYNREEICKALGITSEQFSTELLSANTQHGASNLCFLIVCPVKILC